MKSYIIDFEAYYNKSLKIYYIHEFAYFDLSENIFKNFFLSLPRSFNSSKYFFQYRNIIHIPFDYGTTSFNDLLIFLNQKANFYIKGKQKFSFLKQLTKSNLLNLDDYNCPCYNLLINSLNQHYCPFISHISSHRNCALNKVLNLANWFRYSGIKKDE